MTANSGEQQASHNSMSSRTQENYMAAFAGESQANRRYLSFAQAADKEGHPSIARLFRAAAEAETIHALNEFKKAHGVKATADNLRAAIAGEKSESEHMYPDFAAIAREEGDNAAASFFTNVGAAEAVHAELFARALKELEEGSEDKDAVFYLCPICGYIHYGKPEAGFKCPVCNVPGEKFTLVE